MLYNSITTYKYTKVSIGLVRYCLFDTASVPLLSARMSKLVLLSVSMIYRH